MTRRGIPDDGDGLPRPASAPAGTSVPACGTTSSGSTSPTGGAVRDGRDPWGMWGPWGRTPEGVCLLTPGGQVPRFWWQRPRLRARAADLCYLSLCLVAVVFSMSSAAQRGSFTLLLGAVLTLVATVLLVVRRRRNPLAVALVALAPVPLTASATVFTLALFSLSIRRRTWPLAPLAVAGTLAAASNAGGNSESAVPTALAICLGYVAIISFGAFIGVRRDLVFSLRERAEQAESEVVLRGEQARLAERTRIAREMHDVVAHRISLIALHAGALELNPGCGPEQVERTATLIGSTSRQALEELRGILGVLRAGVVTPSAPVPSSQTGSLSRGAPVLSSQTGSLSRVGVTGQVVGVGGDAHPGVPGTGATPGAGIPPGPFSGVSGATAAGTIGFAGAIERSTAGASGPFAPVGASPVIGEQISAWTSQWDEDVELAPQPRLADVPRLVETSAAAGVSVRLELALLGVSGESLGLESPELAVLDGVTGRTVYRVVQEGLTNVHKHARDAATYVGLWGSPGTRLWVSVANVRPVAASLLVPGSGVGLLGLRERVMLAGGMLEAGPDGRGGFQVNASFPWPPG